MKCTIEKKNEKKVLLRKSNRKGERKKISKRSCRKIKGWRRINLGCLITKAQTNEMSFKVLEIVL